MTAWLTLAPAVITAVALSTLPGTLLAWALRFRGLTFVAASIAGSFAVISLASIIAPFIGMDWGLAPVFIVALVAGAILLLTRLFNRNINGAAWFDWRSTLTYGGALGLAFVLVSWTLVQGFDSPENIAQNYDSVFHLNATHHILTTGDASPFHMTLANPVLETTFYPTAWHATASLISQIAGATVPAASNAFAIAVAGWVWPVAILFFSRPFFVTRNAHVLAGAVLAASFATFPYSFLYWGVLYPNLLSYALIPITLGFLHLALRYRHRSEPVPLASVWIATVGSLGAAALAHPNAFLSIVALATPLFVVTIWDIVRRGSGVYSKVFRISGILLTFVAFGIIWSMVTTGDSSREHGASIPGAIIAILGTTPFLETRGWFLTILILIGIALFTYFRRHRWLIGSFLIVVGLYVTVTSFEGQLRDLFTIGWYNDGYRIAALLPIVALPLAGRAVAMLLDLVRGSIVGYFNSPMKDRTQRSISVIATTSLILLVLTGARAPIDAHVTDALRSTFQLDEDSPVVTPDELELFTRISDHVPEDGLIVGNPLNGSALAYAYSDRRVLFPHLKGNYGEAARELAIGFPIDDARSCELLDELGATHMLGSSGFIYFASTSTYQGLDDLGSSALLTPVDREGDATLYEVTGC